MPYWIIVGALLVIAGGCTSAGSEAELVDPDETTGSVDIEWTGPDRTTMLVPVYINDRGPYSFVLDTGATLTCVEAGLARELGLPWRGGDVAVGIAGSGRISLVSIDSLRIGEASAKDLSACAADFSAAEDVGVEFDGLLGLNFLRGYHLSIDFDAGHVTLKKVE